LTSVDLQTTGMDPISRRHVWDIIQNAKKGRAIVLTTHSMEEADILSDRIGIMAKGRLRCIGNSIRLKSKFGTGFIANVSFSDNNGGQTPGRMPSDTSVHHEAVKKFFKYVCRMHGQIQQIRLIFRNLFFSDFGNCFTAFGCNANRGDQILLDFCHSS